uniref:Accessory gland protein Acp29AB n=1 Tax=Drosophila simulans TaxID=7240 RepID=A29AB_DROSI|nr:RecName: Full=Accessory gland protein Acp29AB; Flags: Precursor [Drosophila simulans]CAB53227.1 Acp29AB protein [Drosophila simulans]
MYATNLLYLLALWNLWLVSGGQQDIPNGNATLPSPQKPQNTIDQIGANQNYWFTYNALRQNETLAIIDAMESGIASSVLAFQAQMEIQLQPLKIIMLHHAGNIKASNNIKMSRFEKVGSRYFHIEKNLTLTWFEAYVTCREMNGHLANIRDEKELDGILALAPNNSYWVDISKLVEYGGTFVSTLTGREPIFVKWKPNQDKKKQHNCVYIYAKEMYYDECFEKKSFVCQANQWA